MWIRSPAWDGFWFLSGIPIGLMLWALSPPLSFTFYFLLLFRVGHLASPVALAWSHSGFRGVMLERKVRFVVIPAVVFAAAAIAGIFAPEIVVPNDLNPGGTVRVGTGNVFNLAAWTAIVYFIWNQYHFSMQNFGMLRLYAARAKVSTHRGADKAVCILMTVAWSVVILTHLSFVPPNDKYVFALACCLMSAVLAVFMLARAGSWPRAMFILATISPVVVSFWSIWYAFAAIYLNHWMVAIGLAAHVDGNRHSRSPMIFAVAMIAGGAAFFLGRGSAAALLGASLGLSFVHFLYDQCLYKLSDPQVRATIGHDLLGRKKQRLARR
jgi:hypothetical protein